MPVSRLQQPSKAVGWHWKAKIRGFVSISAFFFLVHAFSACFFYIAGSQRSDEKNEYIYGFPRDSVYSISVLKIDFNFMRMIRSFIYLLKHEYKTHHFLISSPLTCLKYVSSIHISFFNLFVHLILTLHVECILKFVMA